MVLSNLAPLPPHSPFFIIFIILNIVEYLYAILTIPSVLGLHPKTPYPYLPPTHPTPPHPTPPHHVPLPPPVTNTHGPSPRLFLHFYYNFNSCSTSNHPTPLYPTPSSRPDPGPLIPTRPPPPPLRLFFWHFHNNFSSWLTSTVTPTPSFQLFVSFLCIIPAVIFGYFDTAIV